MEENKNQNNPEQPEQNDEGVFQTTGAFIWDLVKILLIALVIILPFRTFVAEPFVVHSYIIPDLSDSGLTSSTALRP